MAIIDFNSCMNVIIPENKDTVTPVPRELRQVKYNKPGIYPMMYAIVKGKNGRITGIRVRLLEIKEDGEYRILPSAELNNADMTARADKNGYTNSGMAIYNVTFCPTYISAKQSELGPDGKVRQKMRPKMYQGVVSGKYEGTMGAISRYPVYGLEGTAFYTRAFTILAYSPVLEYRKKVEVKGKNVSEKFVWERVPYYLIADAEGNIGWITHEHALHLILTYKVTNAQVRGKTLCPINTAFDSVARTFPVVKYTKNTPVSALVTEEYMSAGYYGKDLKSMFKYATKMAPNTKYGLKQLTPENMTVFRNVSDLCNLAPVQFVLKSAFKEAGRFSDLEIDSVVQLQTKKADAIYRKALLSQAASQADIDFMYNLFEQIKLSDIGKLFEKGTSSYKDAKQNVATVPMSITSNEQMQTLYMMFGIKNDKATESDAFGAMLSTMDCVSAMYNVKVYSDFDARLRSVYLTILRNEMQITQAVKGIITSMPDAKLEGENFRIKSPASLTEKVYERARLEDVSTKKAIEDLKDVLRYTLILSVPSYVKDTRDFILNSLKSALDLTKFANFWAKDDNPYCGINSALRKVCTDNSIIIFEMQFHTQESFDLKNGKGHELYEKTRAVDTDFATRRTCLKQAFEESSKLTVPPGVRDFDMYEYVADDIKARDKEEAAKKKERKQKMEAKLRKQEERDKKEMARLAAERAAHPEPPPASPNSNGAFGQALQVIKDVSNELKGGFSNLKNEGNV